MKQNAVKRRDEIGQVTAPSVVAVLRGEGGVVRRLQSPERDA
ncbi:hypothetical protein ACPUER_33090 [Burkholderia sp. DN3021]|nr:hypothetical protein [Burkholderia pyrrocinia]